MLGPIAVPSEIDFTPNLPKTRSGKIMRLLLRAQELGLDPREITMLAENGQFDFALSLLLLPQ